MIQQNNVLLTFISLNFTSKSGEFNVMHNFDKYCPGYWLLATSHQPLLQDFCIDLFRIVLVFVGMQ